MEKLIITCCVFDERPQFPAKDIVNIPKTIKEVADSSKAAHDAGAAVVHVHQPEVKGGSSSPFNKEAYLDLTRQIRQCDVIYEHRGPGPYACLYEGRLHQDPAAYAAKLKEWRSIDLGDYHPDMTPVIIGPEHMDWGVTQHYVMPNLEELETAMRYYNKVQVKPAFEVWGANSLHNLRRLIGKGVLNSPYWLELCMGVTGSTSPPANVEELLYITKKLPERSMWYTLTHTPPKGDLNPQQMFEFYAQTIIMGGHVRIGQEDCPYFWDGSVAKSNAQIVESIVKFARGLGREIATSTEARQMLGLPPYKSVN